MSITLRSKEKGDATVIVKRGEEEKRGGSKNC